MSRLVGKAPPPLRESLAPTALETVGWANAGAAGGGASQLDDRMAIKTPMGAARIARTLYEPIWRRQMA
ncbi:MAG TPA: hypothetical protein VHR17_18025 [Thermoanaerobaculia bacterium]|jgi:hypothetical protein|nr:hypothetical protein [Thermoanaerobaculia bacterium]